LSYDRSLRSAPRSGGRAGTRCPADARTTVTRHQVWPQIATSSLAARRSRRLMGDVSGSAKTATEPVPAEFSWPTASVMRGRESRCHEGRSGEGAEGLRLAAVIDRLPAPHLREGIQVESASTEEPQEAQMLVPTGL